MMIKRVFKWTGFTFMGLVLIISAASLYNFYKREAGRKENLILAIKELPYILKEFYFPNKHEFFKLRDCRIASKSDVRKDSRLRIEQVYLIVSTKVGFFKLPVSEIRGKLLNGYSNNSRVKRARSYFERLGGSPYQIYADSCDDILKFVEEGDSFDSMSEIDLLYKANNGQPVLTDLFETPN